MRFLIALCALAFAGCIGRPSYTEPDPIPIQVPARPPERILRRPADFRFTDYTTGKQFFYRMYSEGEGVDALRQEIITVLSPGAVDEIDATDEERAYALKVLTDDWLSKDMKTQLEYHQVLHKRERRRVDTGLDTKIHYAMKAVAEHEDMLFNLEADLQSSRKTPGYQAKPGHLEFLESQIAVTKVAIAEQRGRLETFQFLKAQMDREDVRSSMVSPK